jgi:ComF family protein
VYGGSLQQMILSFKKGKTEIDELLGRLAESAMQGSDFYKEIELLVPVPLHWLRRLGRGYNQSLILAKQLRHPEAKISSELVRIRQTKPQPVAASAAARVRNVAGAFAVRGGHNFEGSVVCLVDDIKTSGATLNECAKVLKEAGAAKVYAVVLAVAGQSAG